MFSKIIAASVVTGAVLLFPIAAHATTTSEKPCHHNSTTTTSKSYSTTSTSTTSLPVVNTVPTGQNVSTVASTTTTTPQSQEVEVNADDSINRFVETPTTEQPVQISTEMISKQKALAYTGNKDVLPLVIIGIALFVIGFFCVGVSREMAQANE